MKQPHTADTGDETAPVAPANTGFRPSTSANRHIPTDTSNTNGTTAKRLSGVNDDVPVAIQQLAVTPTNQQGEWFFKSPSSYTTPKAMGTVLSGLQVQIPTEDGRTSILTTPPPAGRQRSSTLSSDTPGGQSSATSFIDLTPLPSPNLFSDPNAPGVFRYFNGNSPPMASISRMPSLRYKKETSPVPQLAPSAGEPEPTGRRVMSEYHSGPFPSSPSTVHPVSAGHHTRHVIPSRLRTEADSIHVIKSPKRSALSDEEKSPDLSTPSTARPQSSGAASLPQHVPQRVVSVATTNSELDYHSQMLKREQHLRQRQREREQADDDGLAEYSKSAHPLGSSLDSQSSVRSSTTTASSAHTSPELTASQPPSSSIYDAYDIDMNKTSWRELRPLGRGAFSRVVLAVPHTRQNYDEAHAQRDHNLVAIKIVEVAAAGGASRERIESGLRRELDILKHVQHPSLIKLLAFNIDDNRALMVLQYCRGGDLFDLASSHRNELTSLLVRRIFAEVVNAVMYLHSQNIVHRDIKLENVLLNIPVEEMLTLDPVTYPYSLVTLTDLGLARRIDPSEPTLTTRCGSEDYVPPELLMGQPYDGRQTDSWALGVLLYAIMEGRLPFDAPRTSGGGRSRGRTAHRIARIEWSWGVFKDEPDGTPNTSPNPTGLGVPTGQWDREAWTGGKEIVKGCLQRRNKRWSAFEIGQRPWVKEVLPKRLIMRASIDGMAVETKMVSVDTRDVERAASEPARTEPATIKA
ncbi:kinase-like domain-containing protein [Yarrowia lipolytica]|nr:kinase-like domain-containing protein [Yarrowia lipolytica]RDW55128.1 kinase-like domain-containing protein [Yarrowia lipolytica]